jgi:hypothetical protein
MSERANSFLVFATVTVVATAALTASPSAQNSSGTGDPAQASSHGSPYADMPNAVSPAANAKANAAMVTEPAVLPTPSQSDDVGGAGSAQMGTSSGAAGEMPNSLVPGSAVARVKAEAAMATVPDAGPKPFPVGKAEP